MHNKTYTFGCGCKHSAYLTDHRDGKSIGKYCPKCFDPEQTLYSLHNRRCRLLRLKTACEICGADVVKQSGELGNTKYFYCKSCRKQREAEAHKREAERYRIRKAAEKLDTPVAVSSGADSLDKIIVTCPRCGGQRKAAALDKYGFEQPKRQYCACCKTVARRYADGDNAVYNSDIIIVSGKQVAA